MSMYFVFILFLWENCFRIVSGNFNKCKFFILLVLILKKVLFLMNVGVVSRIC